MGNVSFNQYKKDQREWAIIRLFRSSFTAFPLGELEKCECPDFILSAGSKKIGIELTELKYEREDRDFNLRAHEDFLTDIMNGAKQIVEKVCDQVLVVDVHFTNELGPSVSVPKEKASQLMRLAFTEAISKIEGLSHGQGDRDSLQMKREARNLETGKKKPESWGKTEHPPQGCSTEEPGWCSAAEAVSLQDWISASAQTHQ